MLGLFPFSSAAGGFGVGVADQEIFHQQQVGLPGPPDHVEQVRHRRDLLQLLGHEPLQELAGQVYALPFLE